MKYLIILLLFLSQFTFGQNSIEFGLSYGTSSAFRVENNSHYDYTNNEIGLFIEKNYAWKLKKETPLFKKYWAIQSSVYLGDYVFKFEEKNQKIFKIITFGGVKLEKDLGKLRLNLKPLIGAGYNSGYHNRLAKGLYFTEQLSVGLELPLDDKKSLILNLGGQHISNANVYKLNRGAEIAFVQIGIRLP